MVMHLEDGPVKVFLVYVGNSGREEAYGVSDEYAFPIGPPNGKRTELT